MRLIDAELLMEKFISLEFTSDMGDAMEILDHSPTVDAIPVEWINDWYEKYQYAEVGDLLNDWMAERKEE